MEGSVSMVIHEDSSWGITVGGPSHLLPIDWKTDGLPSRFCPPSSCLVARINGRGGIITLEGCMTTSAATFRPFR